MKKVLVSLVGLLCIAANSPVHSQQFSAVSPSGHTLYYEVNPNTWDEINTVTVKSTDNPNYVYGIVGNLIIPSSVTYNGNTYTVSRIGNFRNCSGMTSIALPNTILLIYNNAFEYCSGLTSITLPSSVTEIWEYAFKNCSGLTSINMPDGITYIGDGAFSNCTNLTSFTIPCSLTSFGDGVFYNCLNLTSVTYKAINYVGPSDYVTNIFNVCVNLDTIIFDSGVSSINNYVFSYCPNISVVKVEWTNNIPFCTNHTYGSNYNPFYEVPLNNATLIVPVGTRNLYSTLLPWSQFGGIVEDSARTVTVSSNNNNWGTVTGSGVFVIGYVDTLIATPNYGYHFTSWSDGDTNNPRTITVDSNVTYSAVFTPNSYTVTVLSADTTIGAVSGSGLVDYNTIHHITATPIQGYHFIHWSDGNTNASRNIIVTKDTTLTAYFEITNYIINVQANNSTRGTVSGGDTVHYGDSVTITAIPNYGYYFQRWNDNNTDNPRTVVVTQNKTYTAYFNPNSYTITLYSADSSQGNVTGSGSFNYLTNRQIKAIPITGHHFTHWSDGDSNATRTISVIQDTVLTAYFEINSYQLTVLPNDSTLGSVTGSGVYTHGTQVTVTATPAQGVRFDRWNDNTLLRSYSFTLTNNKQLIAVFLPIDTVFIHDTTYLWQYDTTYIDNYIHDTTIVVNWIYDTTYLWQYDTTYINNYIHDTTIVDNWIYDTTIVVDTLWLTQYDTVWLTLYDTVWLHDTIIVHDTIYITQEGIGDVAESSIKLYQSNGQIVVEGAAGKAVYMYDINGRLLMCRTENEERRTFDVPVSGAYLIKVGELPARKIVVIR